VIENKEECMKIFIFPKYVNEKTIKKIYDLNVNA